MVDMTNESSAGPSATDRALHAHLTNHIKAERALLDEYTQIAERTQSKAFRYLVKLLIDDEVRHHKIFSELADSVESVALMKAEEPAVPFIDFARGDRVEILTSTERLLEHENEDAHELKRLQHEIRHSKESSLSGLLVELMQRDTEKHIAILEFVRKHARDVV